MEKADHSGHRARLREKYLNFGAEALAPHEVLELLLFYAIPYRNTNDIAKNLLDHFGSLSAVLDASMEMLIEAGLTANQAVFLKVIPDVTRLYLVDKHDNPGKIIDPDAIGAYLVNKFVGIDQEEHVVLLLVDQKMKELYCSVIANGSFSATEISVRRILNLALNYNASGVIIAHNHPSGIAVPSKNDYHATKLIRDSLSLIGVELLDHYIIADRDAVSMRQSGLLD